ncbi:MAG: beta-galactosidase GalB [Bacteroidota bacterium]
MKKITQLLLFSILFVHLYAQNKNRQPFNEKWKFKLDSVNKYDDPTSSHDDWRTLNLPHDWSIEGTFSKDNPARPDGGALPGGIGWYTRKFSIPVTDKGKQVFIEFDGVYRNSEVWINGYSLGVRPNGYISFQYDLTPHLHYGSEPNVITVKVDNSKQPNSRWYSGSGIYRNVWLTTVDKVHVDHYGTFISTPQVSEKAATVKIVTSLRNSYATDHNVTVQTAVYDATGKQVGRTSSNKTIVSADKVVNNPAVPVTQSITVEKPLLWSIEKPSLYKAVTQLIINGKAVDAYETKFGIRTFQFDIDKGFFLNGKSVKILGVCDHHDLGALGAAINTRALQRQLEILKGMGCNGIRTSHNPPAPELLDLCDKMGFIVMDEAFDMWAKAKTKYDYHLDWKEWHQRDLEDQILRDRNHPSVLIWSVGNEIPEQGGDPAKGDTSGRVIARELVNIVKALDTTRPITTANNNTGLNNNIILSGALDLVGYNYNHNSWEKFRERRPGKKLIITESTSALETRGSFDNVNSDTIRRWPRRVNGNGPFINPAGDYTVSAYDNVSAPWGSTHEESIKALKKSDHVSGMYIWTGFDYLGEPTPYTWPARSSYFGIIDLAGFPKDVYYLYQSEFTDKPVLHIYPHWNWKQGDTVDVVCYYNKADEVELFLNNRSFGVKHKTGDDLHIKWRIPFEPGTVKAVSRRNGKTVLTKEIKTAGEPAGIILEADRNTIHADSKDLSFITATIVDKNGVKVPNANNLVEFNVSGPGIIESVDSGDPVSHESFKANKHTALNGLALAIIRSNGKPGKITITATSNGHMLKTITLEAK